VYSTRIALLAVALAAGVSVAFAYATPARAEVLCWQSVLNAWAKGDLGSNYPLRCYREAVQHLPADVRGYSSAPDDIQRALIRAIANGATSRRPASVHTSDSSSPVASGSQPEIKSSGFGVPLPLAILGGWLVVALAGSMFVLRRRRRT
jgi:hypothetical protein